MMEVDAGQIKALRPHVKYALAWRVVSELFRRHHSSRGLRVFQFFPGLSPWGELRVTQGKPYSGLYAGPHIDFQIGGGGIGTTTVGDRGITRYSALLDDYGLEGGTDTDRVVDEIEAALGWPKGGKQPTTPSVLSARVIARFLERYMVAPQPYRLSPGGIDNAASYSGGEPVGWLNHISERRLFSSLDEKSARSLATRFWLLHSTRSNGPAISWDVKEDGPSVVIDIGTSECIPLHGAKRINLMNRYLAHGHKILPVLHELELLAQAP